MFDTGGIVGLQRFPRLYNERSKILMFAAVRDCGRGRMLHESRLTVPYGDVRGQLWQSGTAGGKVF